MKAWTSICLDDIEVDYDVGQPEPDVGYAGGVVINSLWYMGKDITNLVSEKELDAIADTIILDTGDDGRGDYEYDRRKDYALEQAATARSLAADPDGRYK